MNNNEETTSNKDQEQKIDKDIYVIDTIPIPIIQKVK